MPNPNFTLSQNRYRIIFWGFKAPYGNLAWRCSDGQVGEKLPNLWRIKPIWEILATRVDKGSIIDAIGAISVRLLFPCRHF